MQDLIAGRIDYQCPLIALAISQIEGKNVKPLSVFTATARQFCQRSPRRTSRD